MEMLLKCAETRKTEGKRGGKRGHPLFEVWIKPWVSQKATERVRKNDLKGLRALAEELPLKRKIVVCMETSPWQEDDGIEIIPLAEFLQELSAETI